MADDHQDGGARTSKDLISQRTGKYSSVGRKPKGASSLKPSRKPVIQGTLSAQPVAPPPANPLVIQAQPPSAAFAFPAIPAGTFNNIYELVAFYHPAFSPGNVPAGTPNIDIYDECARMLALFAMADVRHDFQSELDIDIYTDLGGEKIGAYLCRLVCSAFYASGSARFNTLYTYVLREYAAHMSSDSTAKKFILAYLDNFYNTIIVPNRALFADTAYMAPYDTSSKGTYVYENGSNFMAADAVLEAAYNAITIGNPDKTYILVDAQMGNPLERIFSRYPLRANVIYNFTCALDAAPKPIASMHTYLNAFVQQPFAGNTTTVPPHLTSFGLIFTPKDFAYDGEWKTNAQIQLGGLTLTETFGPSSKASVDELALVPVRAGMSRQDIQEEVAKLSRSQLSQHQKIGADHVFKSLGDRLQSALIMRIYKAILRYIANGNLTKNGMVAGAMQINLGDADNVVEFTNDILAAIQNYLMQVNTVYTGNKQVIIYIYNIARHDTEADITSLFVANRVPLHGAIQLVEQSVSVADATSFLATIFDAFAAKRALKFCRDHFLFRLFTREDEHGDIVASLEAPADAAIREAITRDNYKSLVSFREPIQRIREISLPPEISKEAFNTNIMQIMLNIATLNNEAKSTKSGGAINTFYNNYALVATSLEHYLGLCVPNHTFLLTHLLIKQLAPFVSSQLYGNDVFRSSLLTFGRGTKLVNVYSQAIKGYFTETEGTALTRPDGAFGLLFDYISKLAVEPTLAGINAAITDVNRRVNATANERIKAVYSFLAPYANMGIVIQALKAATPEQITALLRSIAIDNNFKVNNVVFQRIKKVERKSKPGRAAISSARPKTMRTIPSSKNRSIKQIKKARASRGRKTFTTAIPFTAPLERHPRADRIRGMISSTNTEPVYQDIEYITGGKITLPSKDILSKIKAGFGKLLMVPVKGITYYLSNIRRALFGQRGSQRGGGGGSRSLKRIGAEELCLLKVGFVESIIGRADYRYAAYTHYMAKNFLDILLGDYYAVRKSRSAPVSIRSLAPPGPLSVIVEEEEGVDYEAEGGGTKTITDAAAKSKQVITLPGSRVHTFADAAMPASFVPFSGKGHTIVNPLADRGSVQKTPSGEKIEFVTKAEGKEIINQQLLAFFWLGFSRSPEFIKMERDVFSKLLPSFDITYIGDIQNEIFWQPLLQQIDVPIEDFFALFERSVLPEFEGRGLTPIRRRLQRETQVRATTRRLSKK